MKLNTLNFKFTLLFQNLHDFVLHFHRNMEKNICKAANVLITKMLHYRNYISTSSFSKILSKFKLIIIAAVLVWRFLWLFNHIAQSNCCFIQTFNRPLLKKHWKKRLWQVYYQNFTEVLPEFLTLNQNDIDKQRRCWMDWKSQRRTYNQFHIILRLFAVLPNFPFTSSATMCYYYL